MKGGDAHRITSAPKGVQQFAWSPDGSIIAFATEDEPEKKTGPERFNDSFEVGNDDFLIQSQALPTHATTRITITAGVTVPITTNTGAKRRDTFTAFCFCSSVMLAACGERSS